MKLKTTLVLLFLSFTFIYSQNKQFTYEDIVLNAYTKLAPENLSRLNWFKDADKYYWIEKDTINVSDEEDISLDEINSVLEKNNIEKLKSLRGIKSISEEHIFFKERSRYVCVGMKEGHAREIDLSESNYDGFEVAPNNQFVVANIGNNISLINHTEVKKITDDKNKDIISGQSVSRNEFGINGGIFISPKSNFVAFYQKDVSNVADYPLVNITSVDERPSKLDMIKYPMNSQPSEVVKIGVYNVETKETIFLKTTGEKEQYLVSVTWNPDEKYLFVAHLNRLQNHMQLFKYNAQTGEQIKMLFEEKSDKFVEPENPLHFLPNGNFLWFSERDNWNHLYLYDIEGNLIKQVTSGNWVVLSIDKIIDNNQIVISATKESPLERHQYLVNIETKELTKLTKESGTHTSLFSNSNKKILDIYTSTDVPRRITLKDFNGNNEKVLLNSKNPIEDYAIGKQKIFKLKNNNGVELYSRITYPVNFDSTKKYPVIFYVYGGPHVQLITNRFGYGRYDYWFQKMAQLGFIVFTLDNQGSANRGLEFEQGPWHHHGTVEVQDQLVGVEYLKSLPYVDENRFGVFGWSYGGYMTTSLMLRSNDAFKVGVAGGAVIDWRFYEIMYGERYMGNETTNKDGLEECSLLNYVENLNGRLLMVHGTNDNVVVWQHTLSFLSKATTLNKRLDYYPYVGSLHGVGGIDAVNLYQKLTEYFIENL